MARNSALLLKVALGLNLALSMVSGLVAVLSGSTVAGMVGALPAWAISGIGVGLIAFSVGISWTLARIRIGYALLISGLDFLWVLTTLPLTFIPGLLTPVGTTTIVLLALAVGGLGLLQLAGIRAILSEGAEPGQFRHRIRVGSSSDPEKLWRVIRDLGAISRYSAGLSASRLDGGPAAALGTVRVCTNTQGQSWAEEVETLDDDARLVSFRFRSEAKDFPFPLAALSGGWAVTPDAEGGAFVEVWWLVRPKLRHGGWLIVALMTVSLDRSFPAIIAAMEADALGARAPAHSRTHALSYC